MVRFLLGFATGLALYAVSCYANKAIEGYAEVKITPYPGPRFHTYQNGVKQ